MKYSFQIFGSRDLVKVSHTGNRINSMRPHGGRIEWSQRKGRYREIGSQAKDPGRKAKVARKGWGSQRGARNEWLVRTGLNYSFGTKKYEEILSPDWEISRNNFHVFSVLLNEF